MQELDFLDPTNDYVFKRMLCESQPALLSMINAIVQPSLPIREAIVQNSEVLAPDPNGHSIRLDILSELQDGSQINIEMQSWAHPALQNRLLYYFSSLYNRNLQKGEAYKRLNPVYVVTWTRKALFHDGPFQSIFELRERRSGRVLTPHCQIQVLQLEKIQHPLSKAQSLLSHWAHFLANRDPSRYDEIARFDPGIHDAMTTLKALSQNEKARLLAKAREDAARMDYEAHCVSREAGLEEGRKQGLEEGREQGREEGREQGREEGREQGREEGREQGVLQGETRALLRILAKRFGELPESTRESIERASIQQLRDWVDRALDGRSLDELFANKH